MRRRSPFLGPAVVQFFLHRRRRRTAERSQVRLPPAGRGRRRRRRAPSRSRKRGRPLPRPCYLLMMALSILAHGGTKALHQLNPTCHFGGSNGILLLGRYGWNGRRKGTYRCFNEFIRVVADILVRIRGAFQLLKCAERRAGWEALGACGRLGSSLLSCLYIRRTRMSL